MKQGVELKKKYTPPASNLIIAKTKDSNSRFSKPTWNFQQ